MSLLIIENTADWHAHQAIKAYRKKDYDAYKRHIDQADELRDMAAQAIGEDPQ
jgi:cellobiose-specific phosphotransferase system component IIA